MFEEGNYIERQTLQLKIFLKRINLQKASKIQQELKHMIFDWLLFLAITKQFVKKISTYPLVPEPQCYCHPDGSLRNSPKSKFFQYVKGLLQPDSPPNVKTGIEDEMFLIRSIRRCRTYRLFVQTILKTVLFVSMFTNHDYLKIVKDRKGVMTNPNVSVIGSQQKMPSDFDKLLKLSCFKKQLLRFFLRKLIIQSMLQ